MKDKRIEHDDQINPMPAVDPQGIRERLLNWYDRSGRDLPWRQRQDAYAIWLSEIMLQQTQIQTALPFYQRFLTLWPQVTDLALATEEQVLKAWEGLGYYSRARNLHRTAKIVAGREGQFPPSAAGLRQLPGIGAYTAGAIASIAFQEAVPAVDGNVVRVIARLAAQPWVRGREADRKSIEHWLEPVIPPDRPGDFNQALMDLGATRCLPSNPRCADCPLRSLCVAASEGTQDRYPLRRAPNKQAEEKKVVLIFCRDGKIRVNRQDEEGLLSGLYAFDWLDSTDPDIDTIWPEAERVNLGHHVHIFSHRRWQMQGWLILLDSSENNCPESQSGEEGIWLTRRQLDEIPMARALSVFRDRLFALDYCR